MFPPKVKDTKSNEKAKDETNKLNNDMEKVNG